ncbi:hypothetical protein ARMSODRAFT_604097 [Armillaria solidipes]|uniref:Secreted protein n=1 Tax=Armillaria solidipes TaxID=1076256 RepID=A0A2H3B982_9AGAR|nr:hypothetical protein ARMSODRAFT_604097 [Armillaria solidipes]
MVRYFARSENNSRCFYLLLFAAQSLTLWFVSSPAAPSTICDLAGPLFSFIRWRLLLPLRLSWPWCSSYKGDRLYNLSILA